MILLQRSQRLAAKQRSAFDWMSASLGRTCRMELFFFDHDGFGSAEHALKRAVELNPNFAFAYSVLGYPKQSRDLTMLRLRMPSGLFD